MSRTTACPSGRRRLRFVWIALLSVVLLEFGLQVASYVAYLSYARDEVALGSADGATILCIGDSYTYGLGASSSDTAYPGVLRRELTARGLPQPTVVNAAWPGQNSRDLLQRLAAQLDDHEPDVVLILTGLNDQWSRPARLDDAAARTAIAESSATWRWRWRTGRLFAWAFGDRAPVAATTGASKPDSERRAADEEELARAEASRLQREFEREPTADIAVRWSDALVRARDRSAAGRVAREGVERWPDSPALWYLVAEEHYNAWRLAEAEAAYDKAHDLAPANERIWRARVLRAQCRTCYERDPDKALRSAITALGLEGDFGKCIVALRPGREHFDSERAAAAIAALGLQGNARQAGERLMQTMLAITSEPRPDPAVDATLRAHLEQLVALCRSHGTTPILLTYPMATPLLDDVIRAVANATATRAIPLRPALEASQRPRNELFIPDGHCSDGGYRLMGETIAAALAPLLQR